MAYNLTAGLFTKTDLEELRGIASGLYQKNFVGYEFAQKGVSFIASNIGSESRGERTTVPYKELINWREKERIRLIGEIGHLIRDKKTAVLRVPTTELDDVEETYNTFGPRKFLEFMSGYLELTPPELVTETTHLDILVALESKLQKSQPRSIIVYPVLTAENFVENSISVGSKINRLSRSVRSKLMKREDAAIIKESLESQLREEVVTIGAEPMDNIHLPSYPMKATILPDRLKSEETVYEEENGSVL